MKTNLCESIVTIEDLQMDYKMKILDALIEEEWSKMYIPYEEIVKKVVNENK